MGIIIMKKKYYLVGRVLILTDVLLGM